ncbi:MAG TPA: SRPBCC domain-containing protein, partial [Acidimicrobiales bacterium]|nr:SRPBCC domain-containing protein [Acidimicrobiales bacterium]
EPDGDGSRLTFTQGLPDRSGAARQGAGWHTCLDALGAHLDGSTAAGDWQPLYRSYIERMGPSVAEVVATRPTLRWERTHHVDAARVWQAITDADEWSSWMQHGITISSLSVGGSIELDFGPEHGRMSSVITALEKGRRFAFTFGDASITEWTVSPAQHGCRYTLTQHNAEPDTAGGWHHHLLTLDMFLASGQVVPQDPALSHALYAEDV